jgi:hypothetical protein
VVADGVMMVVIDHAAVSGGEAGMDAGKEGKEVGVGEAEVNEVVEHDDESDVEIVALELGVLVAVALVVSEGEEDGDSVDNALYVADSDDVGLCEFEGEREGEVVFVGVLAYDTNEGDALRVGGALAETEPLADADTVFVSVLDREDVIVKLALTEQEGVDTALTVAVMLALSLAVELGVVDTVAVIDTGGVFDAETLEEADVEPDAGLLGVWLWLGEREWVVDVVHDVDLETLGDVDAAGEMDEETDGEVVPAGETLTDDDKEAVIDVVGVGGGTVGVADGVAHVKATPMDRRTRSPLSAMYMPVGSTTKPIGVFNKAVLAGTPLVPAPPPATVVIS